MRDVMVFLYGISAALTFLVVCSCISRIATWLKERE